MTPPSIRYIENLTQQFLGFLNTSHLFEGAQVFNYPPFTLKEKKDTLNYPLEIEIPGNPVLGKRVEYFFAYYINFLSNEKLIAKNIQVREGTRTLGELDFLLENKSSGKVCHVELVYKYYLYDPEIPSELGRWIGPNRRDSLLRKLSHLEKHQFPLLFRRETGKYLKDLGLHPQQMEQELCFLANLFIPFSLRGKKIPYINQDCLQGYWMKWEDFKEDSFGRASFFSPKKPDWTMDPHHAPFWYSYTQIRELLLPLLLQKKSPLVWVKNRRNQYSKMFLVWW